MVAIGPRGGGKSTAVEIAASKRNGTLSVTVTDHSTMYEVIAEAIRAAEFEAFGTESLRADGFTITTDAQLALVMRKAAALRKSEDPSCTSLLFAFASSPSSAFRRRFEMWVARRCIVRLFPGRAGSQPFRSTLAWLRRNRQAQGGCA